LIIQALLFGDGGITAIGANCLNIAFVMPFVGYAVYRWLSGLLPSAKKRGSRGDWRVAGRPPPSPPPSLSINRCSTAGDGAICALPLSVIPVISGALAFGVVEACSRARRITCTARVGLGVTAAGEVSHEDLPPASDRRARHGARVPAGSISRSFATGAAWGDGAWKSRGWWRPVRDGGLPISGEPSPTTPSRARTSAALPSQPVCIFRFGGGLCGGTTLS
jgi:cobalt/nickel transport system permease protein